MQKMHRTRAAPHRAVFSLGEHMTLDPTTYEYLNPTDEQNMAMSRVRAAAKAYSDILDSELPDGPDKTFVLRNHRSNAMWANVAITRHPNGSPR